MLPRFYSNVNKYLLFIDKKALGLYIILLLIISCFVVYKALKFDIYEKFFFENAWCFKINAYLCSVK